MSFFQRILLHAYVGLSLPVIRAGVLSELANPKLANVVFAVIVAAFAAATVAAGAKGTSKLSVWQFGAILLKASIGS